MAVNRLRIAEGANGHLRSYASRLVHGRLVYPLAGLQPSVSRRQSEGKQWMAIDALAPAGGEQRVSLACVSERVLIGRVGEAEARAGTQVIKDGLDQRHQAARFCRQQDPHNSYVRKAERGGCMAGGLVV